MSAKSYFVETYGCQMNAHDSERIAGLLEDAGMVPVQIGTDADVIVFNTCAVRENADNKLYGNLSHLALGYRSALVAITPVLSASCRSFVVTKKIVTLKM